MNDQTDGSDGFRVHIRGEDIVGALMTRMEGLRQKMAQVGSSMKQLETVRVTAPIENSPHRSRFAL